MGVSEWSTSIWLVGSFLAMFSGCGGKVRWLWPSRIYCGEEASATKIVLWSLIILYRTRCGGFVAKKRSCQSWRSTVSGTVVSLKFVGDRNRNRTSNFGCHYLF
jgi:hypothetical protein